MAALEPTIINLLTVTGLLNSANGTAAINAYNAALAALQNWTQGTAADNVLQLIGALQTIVSGLPIPATYQLLVNVILAGVAAIIGVVEANSPAPAAPAGATVEAADVQAFHQSTVAADTVTKIHALVPGIRLSRFHSAEHQYNDAWNGAVDQGGFAVTLKVAA
jgi:hypothetical protein